MVSNDGCHRSLTRAAALVALVGGMSATAAVAGSGQWVRFLATELETEPTSLATLPPSTIDALLQARISTSPSGEYWAAEVITRESGTVTNRAAISGTRAGIDFSLARLQNIPGLNVAFEASASGIDSTVLVNDSGAISISGNLTGPTSTDEAIILFRRDTQQYAFVAREGSPIPGIAGESFGPSLDQRTLTSDGRVLFRDGQTSGPIPSTQDEFLFLGGVGGAGFTSLAQGGVLVPTGQSVQPNVVMPDIELGFGVSDDGQNYILRGILASPASRVVAVRNGQVLLEQGQGLPGSTTPPPELSTALAITDAGMGPGGDWYIVGRSLPTGTGSTTAPWLIFNGQVIFNGDTDFPGGLPGERVNSISGVNITTRGDLFYSVSTVPQNGFNRTVGVVIPISGPPIVAYETGTPIDFNQTGTPLDDFWFISTVFSAAMGDDGTVYLITRYLNIGDVIGYVPVTLPGITPPNCGPADIANTDGETTITGGGPDGTVDNGDFTAFFVAFFAAEGDPLRAAADIANTDGDPGADGSIDNGDFTAFFSSFFSNPCGG